MLRKILSWLKPETHEYWEWEWESDAEREAFHKWFRWAN